MTRGNDIGTGEKKDKKNRSMWPRKNPLSAGGELNQPADYSVSTSRQRRCLQLLTSGKKEILA
jgi:hypothetical protein